MNAESLKAKIMETINDDISGSEDVGRELHLAMVRNAMEQLKHAFAVLEQNMQSMLFTQMAKVRIQLVGECPPYGRRRVAFARADDREKYKELAPLRVFSRHDVGRQVMFQSGTVSFVDNEQRKYFFDAQTAGIYTVSAATYETVTFKENGLTVTNPQVTGSMLKNRVIVHVKLVKLEDGACEYDGSNGELNSATVLSCEKAGETLYYRNRYKNSISLNDIDMLHYNILGHDFYVPNYGFIVKLKPTRFSTFKMFINDSFLTNFPTKDGIGLEARPQLSYWDGAISDPKLYISAGMVVGAKLVTDGLFAGGAFAGVGAAMAASSIQPGLLASVMGIAGAAAPGGLFGTAAAVGVSSGTMAAASAPTVLFAGLNETLMAAHLVKMASGARVATRQVYESIKEGDDPVADWSGPKMGGHTMKRLSRTPFTSLFNVFISKIISNQLGADVSARLDASILATRDYYQPGYDLYVIANQLLYIQPYHQIASRFGLDRLNFVRFAAERVADVKETMTQKRDTSFRSRKLMRDVSMYQSDYLNFNNTSLVWDILMEEEHAQIMRTGTANMNIGITRLFSGNLTADVLQWFFGFDQVIDLCEFCQCVCEVSGDTGTFL